jgi:hypothetical protein
MSISAYNSHSRVDLAYHKARLVEIEEIAIYYIIFSSHILYQSKPRAYNFRIFAQGLLKVINAIETFLTLDNIIRIDIPITSRHIILHAIPVYNLLYLLYQPAGVQILLYPYQVYVE